MTETKCIIIMFYFRLQINAMMNRASGKGYENENFYTDIKFQFMGIENIHVMRSSLQKLLEGKVLVLFEVLACSHVLCNRVLQCVPYCAVCELKNPSMSAFLSGLESSGWLSHIKAIIDTSAFIAKVCCCTKLSSLVDYKRVAKVVKEFICNNVCCHLCSGVG